MIFPNNVHSYTVNTRQNGWSYMWIDRSYMWKDRSYKNRFFTFNIENLLTRSWFCKIRSDKISHIRPATLGGYLRYLIIFLGCNNARWINCLIKGKKFKKNFISYNNASLLEFFLLVLKLTKVICRVETNFSKRLIEYRYNFDRFLF